MNLEAIERNIIGFIGLLALTIASYQMAARYLAPTWAVDWAGELIIYLIIWSVWLSGGQLVLYKSHVRADIFTRLMSRRNRAIAEMLNNIIGFCFCILLIYCGFKIVELSIHFNEKGDSSAQIPLWIYYLSVPVGALLMLIRYLQSLLSTLSKKEENR